ncbi:MAG: OmpH family outer membrane protein [Gemmatimonadota bacterium]
MRSTHVQAWLAAGALVVASTAGLVAQQADGDPPADAEFVFIDSQQLLQEAPGATEAQKRWQEEMSEYRDEVERLRSELDSLQTAYEDQEDELSGSARQERRREIAEKQQRLQQRAQELEQEAGRRRQELLAPILDEVRSVIREIRDEEGYRMVFDAAASGLLAADPALDITDRVVRRLEDRGGGQGEAEDDTLPGGS